MKKFVLSCIALAMVTFSIGQNLSKVKDAMAAKKYSEASTLLEELINNPKYQKNAELYFLKGKLFSDIAVDANAEKSFPDALTTSLNSFKKAAEMDKSKFVMLNTLEGSQQLFNVYATPYNKGVKSLDAKEYDKALSELQQADKAGRFIFEQGIGLTAIDTNLTFYTGFSALLAGKEEIASQYFTKLANINVAEKGFEDVYKNLMIYHFNKNNLAEFEKVRQQGLKLYPKEEYFTYDEVVFINDMKDEAEKLKRIEAKVNADPKNMDALSIYSEILSDKLLNADSLYPTEVEYKAAESKLVKIYDMMASISPEDGLIPFNTSLIYINNGFRISNKISEVNDKIRKFNDAQKPDKTGKIPPPPKELTTLREDLRNKQQAYFDLGLPYILKAQPFLEKEAKKGRAQMQNYKKLLDIVIEIYSSKRQFAKLPADKAKFEAEEKKWDAIYAKLNDPKIINDKKVEIGMKDSEIRALFGDPEKTNRTVVGNHVQEQWVYKNDLYFYFEDGKLSGWQESK